MFHDASTNVQALTGSRHAASGQWVLHRQLCGQSEQLVEEWTRYTCCKSVQ